MKLLYYEQTPNFGDMLNPFIFKTLLPDFFNENDADGLLGIGSIIGLYKPEQVKGKQFVFSSGFAYGKLPADLSSYEFWCVRGPESARTLGLEPEKAVSDGALLLRHFSFPDTSKKYPYAFMPHEQSLLDYPQWKDLAEEAGIHFISPHAPYDQVLLEIRQTETLFTEAMHGAIVADVFRVPWVPLILCHWTNLFKWIDWTSSMELPFNPVRFPILGQRHSSEEIIRQRINARMPSMGFLSQPIGTLYHHTVMRRRRERARALMSLIKAMPPVLSDEKILVDRSDRLMSLLRKLEKAYR